MPVFREGQFNTEMIPEEPGNIYWFHADKKKEAIHYYLIDHALQSKLPLGEVPLKGLSLEAEAKNVIASVEKINGHFTKPDTADFKNAFTNAKTAGLKFARRILSLEASECLLRCLATPNSTVVFVPARGLRWLPWELCYLRSTEPLPTTQNEPGKAPFPEASDQQTGTEDVNLVSENASSQPSDEAPALEGFINGIGNRFSRIMASGKLGPAVHDNYGKNILIVDKELESIDKQRDLIHDTLKALEINHVHITIKEDLKILSSNRNAVVYMGHQDTERGLRLSTEIFFEKDDLGLFPFPPDGIGVLAMCSTFGTKGRSFASSVADECGCNVIYSLIELPVNVGLEITCLCHKEMLKRDGASFWDVWRRVQKQLSQGCRPYLSFFAMHGKWMITIPEGEESNEAHY